MEQNWSAVLWLLLALWLALMFLPHQAVMWGLVALAVSMLIARSAELF